MSPSQKKKKCYLIAQNLTNLNTKPTNILLTGLIRFFIVKNEKKPAHTNNKEQEIQNTYQNDYKVQAL